MEQAPKIHVVKCWPEFFQPILDGIKTFDLRNDDRKYAVGDYILEQEFKVGLGTYTDREVRCRINYILRGERYEAFGLKPGFAVLAIEVIK